MVFKRPSFPIRMKKQSLKGWRPFRDGDSKPSSYHAALSDQLQSQEVLGLAEVAQV